MESKRLHFNNQNLRPEVLTEGGEIEVPEGESFFYLKPRTPDAEFTFHLRHSGSQTRVTGLVEAREAATPQWKTAVIHHAPETKAETLIRTLVFDQAYPRYQGIIRMEKEAQQCESYLNHHALLLGEKARSWSLPSLEILADQVKCSHAATVRTLTNLDLFYLCSRGLNPDTARQLLIEAFLVDIQKS